MSKKQWFLALVAVAILSFAVTANADVTVYVGYADGLRSGGFFPNPWAGDPGVETFNGVTCCTGPDDGAIRINNTGSSSVVISNFQVTLNPGTGPIVFNNSNMNTGYSSWGTTSVSPGKNVIFTVTDFFTDNFDTSDFGFVAPGSYNFGAGDFGGCNSPDSPAIAALCAANAPIVEFDLDGNHVSLRDNGHVLDTFGYDLAALDNESIGWHEIGAGIGGRENVPEPASLMLLGTGMIGIARRLRRK